jgi:Nuclear transport factor 2 (NTF2) domain
MMTFEGAQLQGPQAIIERLKSLGNGGPVPFRVMTTDVQPSVTDNALLIFVTGTMQFDADKPLSFSEIIQLVSTSPGQYHVNNCIFRICYMM